MNRSDQFPRVREIADAVCSGMVTDEQLAELEQLLRGNFEAQRFYYDYLNMHTYLKAPADNNMQFIYRRLTEEFVVCSKDNGPVTNLDGRLLENSVSASPRSFLPNNIIIIFLVFLTCLSISVVWFLSQNVTKAPIAIITQGSVVTFSNQGHIDDDALYAGDYETEQGATIELIDGDTIHLAANSVIKLFNNSEIRLKAGKLTLESLPKHNTIVHGRTFIVNSNGSDFTFDLTHSAPRITSGKNTSLRPVRWRPIHFWGFDGKSDRVIDSAGEAHGVPGLGVKKINGYVGQGAYLFDNTANSYVDLGSGGGTVPGTGSFAVNDGVTIEALIRPEFSGEFNEIDEIFRKEHGDDELRMLLSFQHDSGKEFLKPEGEVKESLSFGLYILGQGYHELKLPLDGQAGRPTLASLKDGNFHHVAATYNVKTGIKAIYINGERLAYYQYPPGSKILSGGSGLAGLGNNPAQGRRDLEAFSGAIDEVAFYDFALPELMLRHHIKNTQQGLNYFGLPASATPLPLRPQMYLPANSTFELDFLTGLPMNIVNH